jgi:thiamine-phosphate pyrophosphorylase
MMKTVFSSPGTRDPRPLVASSAARYGRAMSRTTGEPADDAASIPRLFVVTDRRETAGRDLVEVVARALDAGLPAVQVRDKDLPGRELFRLAERLREATSRAGARLFVNDRVDVAIAVGADGVHLGGAALAIDVVRALVPERMRIGASTHGVAEAIASMADVVFFGPVYDTPSKRAYGPPQGEGRLRAVVAGRGRPVVAIGGIDAGKVRAVRDAGAHGIAVIRAVLGAGDPAAATRDLLARIAT